MEGLRTGGYILWAFSVLVLVIGGISYLTLTPIAGIGPRASLGLAVALQLYAITCFLLELIQQGKR